MAKYYLVMYGTNDARQAVPIPSGKGLKPGEPGYNQSFKSNLQRILSAILAAGKIPYIAKVPFTAWWTIDILIIQDYNVVIDELVVANNIDVGYESMTDLWFQALTR